MSVHWTGFTQFHGVADNPSRALAVKLAQRHQDTWEAVEVSAEAARQCAGQAGPRASLVIHLGVATTYSAVTIERCASFAAWFCRSLDAAARVCVSSTRCLTHAAFLGARRGSPQLSAQH